MFINSEKYGTLEAACGVQIFFDTLRPRPLRAADIRGISRSNGISSVTLSQIYDRIAVGDKITISQTTTASNFTTTPIPSSYIGDFTVASVTNSGGTVTVTFAQNLPNDSNPAGVVGELYKQANISSADQYIIEYSIETKVPNTAITILRPSSYIVDGNEILTPTTILEATSRFSTSIKLLLKMVVKTVGSNSILKTEYKEIVITDASQKPCEIIYTKPIEISFYELNKTNDWSYYNEGYLLAKFIPYNKNENITALVVKKNNQLLPSRGGSNRIRIIADPIRLQNKKTTIDKIRTAILNQYDTISNSIAIANLGNRSYDIVVEDKLLKPDDFKDIIVDIVPPETGIPVKFSEVATAVPYSQDLYAIPQISLIRWNNNNNIRYLGELQYNEQIYDRDIFLLTISGSVNLSGNIINITNGINYLNEY